MKLAIFNWSFFVSTCFPFTFQQNTVVISSITWDSPRFIRESWTSWTDCFFVGSNHGGQGVNWSGKNQQKLTTMTMIFGNWPSLLRKTLWKNKILIYSALQLDRWSVILILFLSDTSGYTDFLIERISWKIISMTKDPGDFTSSCLVSLVALCCRSIYKEPAASPFRLCGWRNNCFSCPSLGDAFLPRIKNP